MHNVSQTPERMNPKINFNSPIYIEHVIRYLFASNYVKNKNVLDISSGTGYGSYILKKNGASKVTGVDISAESITYAKKTYNLPDISFLIGDAEHLPFPDKHFDIIVSFETIEHLTNHHAFLVETQRLLKRNGLLIISTPNASIHPKGNKFHIKEFSSTEFSSLLKKYFNHVSLLYQGNVLSSYLIDDFYIHKSSFLLPLPTKITANIGSFINTPGKKQLFLMAFASNKPLPKHSPYILLGNKEMDITNRLEKSIMDLYTLLARKTDELDRIYESRGWKIISLLHKIRKLLPIFSKFL